MRSISRCFLVFASCALCLIGFLRKSLIADASSVLTTIDLTPQQTLALYGTTIPSVYYNGSTWSSCEFTYYGYSSSYKLGNNDTYIHDYSIPDYPSGYSSGLDYKTNYLDNSSFLFYVCPVSSCPGIVASSSSYTLQLHLATSIDVSNIAYFRQCIGTSRASVYQDGGNLPLHTPICDYLYCAQEFSYSNAPVIFKALHPVSGNAAWRTPDYFATPVCPPSFDWVSFKSQHESDFSAVPYMVYFNIIDIYGHKTVDGNDTIFSCGSQDIYMSFTEKYYLNPYFYESGNYGEQYFVVALACPRVSDGYFIPGGSGGGGDSGSSSGSSGSSGSCDCSSYLSQILAQLDLIYAKMNVNISGTVNISSSSISGLADAVKGLFVPSSSSWAAFKLNMHGLLQSKFSAFFDAEDTVHDFFSGFDDVSAVSSIRFPGLSLDLPTGSGSDIATFAIASEDVELKPANEEGKLAPLYDCLAVIVDFVCTLAFVNMVRTRFFHAMEGGAENDY